MDNVFHQEREQLTDILYRRLRISYNPCVLDPLSFECRIGSEISKLVCQEELDACATHLFAATSYAGQLGSFSLWLLARESQPEWFRHD